MNQYKIIVNQNELDTYEDDIISLNYQIDDILDVTKRSTNYSKTITLPGTPFNNKFFKQIFDVNIDNITFNPLIKLPAIITIGDNTVMNGSLQLLNIVINQRNVEYEVVITGLLRNILLDITELSLRDIDLSEYNHIRTQDNIVNSWTYNIKNWGVDTQYGGPGTGYVYPYIINGNSSSIWNTLLIYDATPAVYVKTIMEKIFETAGYTYTSNFFDSQYYNKLIIPFTDEKIQVDDEELLLRDVIVGVSGATSGPIEGYVSMTSSEILRGTPWYYNQPYSYDIPLLRESGQVGDIIFKDPSGQWGQYGGFTCQNQGFYDIDLNLKMVARYREGNGVYQFKWTGNGFFKYYYRVQVLRNDGTVQTLSTSIVPLEWQPSDEVDGPGFVGPSFIDITKPLEFSANIQNVFLSEGEQVVIFFAVRYPEDGMTWNIDGFGGDDVRLSMLLDMGLQMINMNQILPDIKMKDFFLNIVKMFNLLILDNPDKENDLIIEPKDEFFKSKQKIRDWTLKLDNDSDVKITPMSELDAKLYYYKYTKDNDYYNEEYFDDTKREYGELKLYVENDFSDTTNKMELIFAPTPNAQEGIDSRVAPSFISKTDGVMKPKKVKPRILFYGGVKDLYTGSELYIKDNELQDEIDYTTSVVYPYCGMWDDPFSPQYDLGFDETDKIYWDTDIRPFYNLYEQFHATTFNAISDVNSRLMEGKFYLTPQDIASFDFRDIILIDNSYWRVVKIKNYNPVNSDKLTDVVLFKINDLNVFAPDQYQVPVSNGSCPTDMIRKRTLNGWVNISSSGQIVTEDCCNQVNGTWVQGVCYAYGVVGNPIDFNNGDTIKPNKLTRSNISPISQKNGSTTSNKNNNTSLSTDVVLQGLLNYVDGGVKNSTIVGDKNYISPNVNNSMIVGDNNSMVPSSENITIFGNNNIVQNEELTGTTTNVFIVGNNITATTSNTLYTDNIQMSSGSTINGVPVSGITNPTLSDVLTNGDTMLTTQKIASYAGLASIELDKVGTEGVYVLSLDGLGGFSKLTLNKSTDATLDITDGVNTSNIVLSPDTIISTATDVASTITDTISIDPQGLSGGTGITSLNTTTNDASYVYVYPYQFGAIVNDPTLLNQTSFAMNSYNIGMSVSDDSLSQVDNINIDAANGTGISSTNNTTGNISSIGLNPDTIISAANDVASDITDTISIDPQLLGNGTGIKSENTTTGEKSYSTYNPSYYETVLDSISINDRRDFITLDTQGYGNETGIKSENILTTNLTGILFNPDNSSMYASDNVNTIYDTISLDPQLLGNGTGIKSENTTTGEFSQIQITPSYIQNVVSDSLNYQGNVEIEYNSGINSLNTTLQTTSLTGSSFGEIKLITDLTLDETTILIQNESGNYITFNKNYSLDNISIVGDLITIGSPSVYKAIQTRTTQTLNATPVNAFVFTNIGDGSKSFKVRVIGTKVGLDKSYYGELTGFYNVQLAIPTQVSTVDLVEKSTFTTATSTLDISGSDIRVRLTGEAATTINWEVIIETNAIQ